jgi:cbb3-type cytochrome oxidase subunit 3
MFEVTQTMFFAFLAGFLIGALVMLFVYRNNRKTIDPYAERVDAFYAKVEDEVLPGLTESAKAEVRRALAKARARL